MKRAPEILRLTGLLLAQIVICTSAQSAVLEDFRSCFDIRSNSVRLACYDRLAAENEALKRDKQFGGQPQNSADSRSKRAKSAEVRASNESRAVTSVDKFGLREPSMGEGGEPKSISSRILGDFTGWSGETKFHLENGQVWQQAEGGKAVYFASNPEVHIKLHLFGSYRLSVPGLNRTVRVKRIK